MNQGDTRVRAITTRLSAAHLALLVMALVTACKSGSERAGSETNWLLECDNDAECTLGSCQCGVCAQTCKDGNACQQQGAVCIAFSSSAGGDCRLGFSEPQSSGLCSHGCSSPTDCPGDGVQCVEGLCLPTTAETPRGAIATLAGDSGNLAPATVVQPVASAIDAAERVDAGAPAEPTTPDAGQPAQPAQTGLGGTTGTFGGLVSSNPTPKPECPCASEITGQVDVPRPGDAAPNAYGRPIPGADPEDLGGGTWALQCETDHLPGFWFVADGDDCIRYSSCDVGCQQDADCPDGGSGTAQPRCARTGACYLDCADQGLTCPDGMACVRGQNGAACYWPFGVLRRECDAYCAQNPIPRECPNWCAGLFVACSVDAGVACCEGLTCTQEGYCDVP